MVTDSTVNETNRHINAAATATLHTYKHRDIMDPGAFAGLWQQNAPNDGSSNAPANAASRPSSVTRGSTASHGPLRSSSGDDAGSGRTERMLGGIMRTVSDTAALHKSTENPPDDEQEKKRKMEAFLKDVKPRVKFVQDRIRMMNAEDKEFEEYIESVEKTTDKDGENEVDEGFEEYINRGY